MIVLLETDYSKLCGAQSCESFPLSSEWQTVKTIMDYVLKSICANNIYTVNIAGRGLQGPMAPEGFRAVVGKSPPIAIPCGMGISKFRMQAVGAAWTRNGRGQVAAGCLAKKGDNAKNCAIDWREGRGEKPRKWDTDVAGCGDWIWIPAIC